MQTDEEMKKMMATIKAKYDEMEQLGVTHNSMVIDLLKSGVIDLFSRSWEYNSGSRFEGKINEGIMLTINTNDWFYWGVSDCEYFGEDDIIHIWKEWKKEPRYGVLKWASKKNNMQPQAPWVKTMKKEGIWDEEWESLPKAPKS
jgi:hypothetical protein